MLASCLMPGRASMARTTPWRPRRSSQKDLSGLPSSIHFSHKLQVDWRLIQTTQLGSHALRDLLDWHEADHMRQQGLIGKSLVKQFMDARFPIARADSWQDIPGAVSMVMQRPHTQASTPKKRPRIIALLDFNAPNARDALKLTQIATEIANIFKHCGPEQCCLLACMASQPKEECDLAERGKVPDVDGNIWRMSSTTPSWRA